jgi:hypothetical protein
MTTRRDDTVVEAAQECRRHQLHLEVAGDARLAAAALLLLKYLLSRPAETVDPDRLDLEEFRLIEAMLSKPEVIRAIVDSVPPETATSVLRPILDDAAKDGLKRVFHGSKRGTAEDALKEREYRTRHKPK